MYMLLRFTQEQVDQLINTQKDFDTSMAKEILRHLNQPVTKRL